MASVNRRYYKFSSEVRDAALTNAGFRCEWCGTKRELGLDHIVPIFLAARMRCLSAEVIRSLANARCLCDSCHKKRHEEELDEQKIGLLVQALLARYAEL